MIFVTVGTEKFPFDRLIRAVEEGVRSGLIREEVFAQTGSSTVRPELFSSRDFIDYDQQVRYIQRARIVVSHAGEGTFLLCMSLGRIPLLFPRRARYGEHVDDHQVQLATKMQERGNTLAAYTAAELLDKVRDYDDQLARLERRPEDAERQRLIGYLQQVCTARSG
ncbi:MAG: glycosyltransferase [Polyangiales bacterium]